MGLRTCQSEVKGDVMNSRALSLAAGAVLLAGVLVGCSRSDTRSPAAADGIRKSLNQVGYKDVSGSQDREKGVVTITGHVTSASDKQQAESIAKSMAVGQVVADEIEVLPTGAEHDARAVNSDLDEGIDKNLDAALIQNKLKKDGGFAVEKGVW